MTTLTQNQLDIWRDRYALRNSQNEVTEFSIEETWKRVARAISSDPQEESDFYGILEDFRFVPGGRILSGAGAQSEKTFYNCYVIPLETKARRMLRELRWDYHEFRVNYADDSTVISDHGNDSREAIMDTIGTMVGIMSRGGGVGINWSVLRPAESHLVRVSGTSSGPVGWMDVASTAVGEVIQGGSRRGAAMFMLDVWHPDILRFIDAKRDNKKITNANVSVGVTDKFMEVLRDDGDWTFEFPDTTHPEYNALWDGDIEGWRSRGLPVVAFGTAKASVIWRSISEAAHASGEPGVIFLDRYNSLSTANGEERIICVNPCGEQGLGAYSVCNLGAMNLYAYIRTGEYYDQSADGFKYEWSERWFDFKRFATDVKTAIRFLDNVIDKTPDYLPEVAGRQRRLRRIGLGVMGLADALVALGLRYGSSDSVKFVEDVFRTMKFAAIDQSSALALEKGAAEGWDNSMWNRPYLRDYLDSIGKPASFVPDWPIRNIFLLTQAPTGTTSMLANVNSGIEPYFNKERVWREDRTGGRWVYPRAIDDLFGVQDYDVLEYIRQSGAEYDYLVDSSEVSVDEHIAIQAAVQKYVDSSVSKTINAPADQTVDETARAFTLAYERGLKGIAYYRDGSRDVQVLYHKDPNERIRELEAKVKELTADEDYWIGKANLFSNPLERPVESIVMGRKNTPVYRDNIQIFGAQGDTDIDRERAAFDNFYFPQPALTQMGIDTARAGTRDWSVPVMDVGPEIWEDVNGCPSCGDSIVHEEGCKKCYGCGWSAC